ncbi:MAG TPA: arsenite methyltransferase [Candidatus Omnitrophota bacterium]|nr:arsenite methyltransferase [Candidatus Omnitrophota bacterium]
MERDIKRKVREGYGKIVMQGGSCCGPSSSCCGSSSAKDISKAVGYSDSEINAVPEGANLGLGCGNPVAIASLKEGQTVLDLGAGAGFDAFLAAKKVGKSGRVIGVDMTPEMIDRARENASKGNYTNVEFRLGEIEKLPVEDDSIDVIISNCVINLSPDKESVFKEAFRVLKTGGSLMVSDLVLTKALPENLKQSVEAYVGCIAGAIERDAYLGFIARAGFRNVEVVSESGYPVDALFEGLESAEEVVASIKVRAEK